jgi:hypothetical protein
MQGGERFGGKMANKAGRVPEGRSWRRASTSAILRFVILRFCGSLFPPSAAHADRARPVLARPNAAWVGSNREDREGRSGRPSRPLGGPARRLREHSGRAGVQSARIETARRGPAAARSADMGSPVVMRRCRPRALRGPAGISSETMHQRAFEIAVSRVDECAAGSHVPFPDGAHRPGRHAPPPAESSGILVAGWRMSK